ncbi:sodium-dependent proline transporter isoform X1 [Anopheles arabiensis]|uniref:Transporter n=2 Tax=gambiae species complex TaxID=44542 RepID=A0A1S4GYD1_ANOGA|nr:sodium-dependent proline transporter isoform X1 [Anopheles arabiensis]XP_061518500.1 sodium-dependent proline transporter [Anopheles gambiae]
MTTATTITTPTAKRGHWASKTEFILSCIGYAIGLGNVWRFPYLCYRNGGGAFLVPYLLMLVLCGIPLFFLETCLGQFSGTGCITVFKIVPLLKGAGIAIVVLNLICNAYYIAIISYPLLFLWRSLQAQLPWESCGNAWNTPRCLELRGDQHVELFLNNSAMAIGDRYRTPADEFFHNEILHISEGIEQMGGIVWPLLLCDVIAWIVIFGCIAKGVQSVGKVVYCTATFPFAILAVLLVRGITLPGALEGIKFYIMPQWSQLLNLRVWADAAIQIFYSLGPGWGGILNMASYNQFKNNTKLDSIVIPIVNCGTSILAGFVVFSVLGYFSHQTGLPVASAATGGPGLAFITYPEAISMLPLSPLWACLFFSMLFFLGVDSMFVQIEAIVSSVMDVLPRLRPMKLQVTAGTCFLLFLLSIACVTQGGMYLVQLLDWYSGSISVILVCIVEVITVGWIYGCEQFVRDVEFMIDRKVERFWIVSWKYITPIVLTFIFTTTIVYNTEVSYNGFSYPRWAIGVGWASCLVSILCIPVFASYKLLHTKGSLTKRFKTQLKAQDWGPADDELRALWSDSVALRSVR